MKKIVISSFIILIFVVGCKSYVQKKLDSKKENVERTELLNKEAKGSHIWWNQRHMQEKYQKYSNRNAGSPNL